MAEKDVRKVAFCPHCSNRAPQTLVFSKHFQETSTFRDGEGNEHLDDVPAANFVAVCETCEDVLLYYAFGSIPTNEYFTSADLVYPKTVFWHGSVPESVGELYEEALRVKNISPSLFAVQIRRALEAVCDDKGIEPGVLKSRLQRLAACGVIPPTLSEMTGVLRDIGNKGAHSGGKVTVAQVWAIDEFFRAIIEYVYVAPFRLSEFKKSMDVLKEAEEEAEKVEP